MAEAAAEYTSSSSGDETDGDVVTSKKTAAYEDDLYEDEDEDEEVSGDAVDEGDGKDAKVATEEDEDEDDDANEEAYKRYEERSSFNFARIEVDEDYEEDLGFPMYYAGYTHRKKQLPVGMDCWKVKNIPADPELLKEMIQDQKVRRDLLAKVMDEVAKEKTRLLQVLAEQEA